MKRSNNSDKSQKRSKLESNSEVLSQTEHNDNSNQMIIDPSAPSTSQYPYYSYNNCNPSNVDSNQYIWPYNMWPNNMSVSDTNMSVKNNDPLNLINADATNNPRETEVQLDPMINGATVRSPSPIMSFNKENVQILAKQIENASILKEPLQVLTRWIQGSEIKKDNCNDIFTLLNQLNTKVYSLMLEKERYKEDNKSKKLELIQKMKDIAAQYREIMRVIEYAKVQKNWDNFSKKQRNQLLEIIKEILKLKDQLLQTFGEDEQEEEQQNTNDHNAEYDTLREEIDTQQHQVQALIEESLSIEMELKSKSQHNKDVVRSFTTKSKEMDDEIKQLKAFKESASGVTSNNLDVGSQSQSQIIQENLVTTNSINFESVQLTENEVKLIVITGAFLRIHPQGANLDYIHSYAATIDPVLGSLESLENLLRRLPKVFVERSSGCGCNIKKTWFFVDPSDP